MRIVVTGSLAYDYLMRFPGSFREHILAEKTETLTVSFLVNAMQRMRGGVAGNIAYTLALLGERPLVFASAGQDFGEYQARMERTGIDPSGIWQVADEFTASCFINTDLHNNQILAFYPGAMTRTREMSLHDLQLTADDYVIISPTDPDAMARHAAEARQIGVPFLFDPGKQTPRFTGEQILDGLNGASAFVSNDYELAMMAQKTGQTEEALIASAPLSVITRGASGSTIYQRGAELHVPAVADVDVVDPTGAGDAYLGGLVFGITRGLPLDTTGRVAALAATYVIERVGCQEHAYTRDEFAERYEQAFGEQLVASV